MLAVVERTAAKRCIVRRLRSLSRSHCLFKPAAAQCIHVPCPLPCTAAIINEAFPVFLTLHSHFHSQQRLPMRLQLLIVPKMEPGLHKVLSITITPHTQLLSQRLAALPAGVQGICFRQLLLGNGGYRAASKASTTILVPDRSNTHAAQYAAEPSFFSSANWWSFRQHVMQVRQGTRAVYMLCTFCCDMLSSCRHTCE
jgi:hypothetical protein